MLTVTRDMILPTTITGSYPRPLWFDRSLDGRSFKAALGDSLFREQYLDAVASIIAEQESAGLDIASRLGLDAALIDDARARLSTSERDIAGFLSEMHRRLTELEAERRTLADREAALKFGFEPATALNSKGTSPWPTMNLRQPVAANW